MASLLAAPSFSPQLRIFQGLRTKAIKTLDSVQVPAIRCSLNSNQTLKTCKICKTQFDPLLNHPRACRFHTAHFGGTPFLLLLHCLFAEKNWRNHNQIGCSFLFFLNILFFVHSFSQQPISALGLCMYTKLKFGYSFCNCKSRRSYWVLERDW